MQIEIIYLPTDSAATDLRSRVAVVFDVLRATTTMITALANGATEIRAFGTIAEAATAHAAFKGPKVLAGEVKCLPPAGFDLGNSPAAFSTDRVEGRTIFLATTNGTRAVRGSASAQKTFVASLANASAMARRLVEIGADVSLVCAGTDGAFSGDDQAGAWTVADLARRLNPSIAIYPLDPSDAVHESLVGVPTEEIERRLAAFPGGLNLLRAGLRSDVAFAAQIDRFAIVAEVTHTPTHAMVRASPTLV